MVTSNSEFAEIFSMLLGIKEVAKLFDHKFKYLPARKGERFASSLSTMNLSNKVHRIYGKIMLKDYISECHHSKYQMILLFSAIIYYLTM